MQNLKLITKIIKNSTELDLAYFWNNWLSLLSVVIYMATNILFIDIIFSKVNNIAGYSRDEILLISLTSQFWFFFTSMIFIKNIQNFIKDVNRGDFDLILSKPLPSLLYTMFRNINLLAVLREGVPSAFLIVVVIKWTNLNLEFSNIAFGILIMITGTFISGIINFIFSLPVFWLGQSQSIGDAFYQLEDLSGHSNFVLEAYPNILKIFFTFFLPTLVSSSISTSVLVGKSNAVEMLAASIFVFITFSMILKFLWNLGLKNYTSASS